MPWNSLSDTSPLIYGCTILCKGDFITIDIAVANAKVSNGDNMQGCLGNPLSEIESMYPYGVIISIVLKSY